VGTGGCLDPGHYVIGVLFSICVLLRSRLPVQTPLSDSSPNQSESGFQKNKNTDVEENTDVELPVLQVCNESFRTCIPSCGTDIICSLHPKYYRQSLSGRLYQNNL
jgi:hypothetical protein